MLQDKTLAIMAAGLGSRFGGLKQLHAINSKNYSIIDYSIYDAIATGFNKIIFIIRKEILNDFKERYHNKLPKHVSIEFVIQDTNKIPKPFKTNRIKPWGTGHALLMLKDSIKEPFVLINADDFYGQNSFNLIFDALFNDKLNLNYFVGYELDKTLSESGYVSRGECFLDETMCLNKIIERSQITKQDDGTIVYFDSNNLINVAPKTPVSMNFWGFSPSIFPIAESLFIEFLNENISHTKTEFYLPSIVDFAIKNDLLKFKMLSTTSQWYGITYKEDQDVISSKILEFTKKGIYPETLW